MLEAIQSVVSQSLWFYKVALSHLLPPLTPICGLFVCQALLWCGNWWHLDTFKCHSAGML